ncbi:hypothetical protein [Paenibacillus odorifer]|uniref:hypothetical protein n=1 Tax=Paenibacillus odorifer TaxID=189426 RepID=UPI001C4D27BE|nr:hypothetical protein [Paenibacillus odorifer]
MSFRTTPYLVAVNCDGTSHRSSYPNTSWATVISAAKDMDREHEPNRVSKRWVILEGYVK